jgi:hypothetical protein
LIECLKPFRDLLEIRFQSKLRLCVHVISMPAADALYQIGASPYEYTKAAETLGCSPFPLSRISFKKGNRSSWSEAGE